MNSRLDYIKNFKDADLAILEMSGCRGEFIALDDKLKAELKVSLDYNLPEMGRIIAIARTNIETACMYAIKALCLKHEKKD
jgi:hypothetical protein